MKLKFRFVTLASFSLVVFVGDHGLAAVNSVCANVFSNEADQAAFAVSVEESKAIAETGKPVLLSVVKRIGLEGLQAGFKVEIEDTGPSSVSNGQREFVYTVSFTEAHGAKGTLKFLGLRNEETGQWKFEFVPGATAPTSRDYFVSLRLGVIYNDPDHVRANALIELQSVLTRLAAQVSATRGQELESLQRVTLLLKRSDPAKPSFKRVLQKLAQVKSSLSDRSVRDYVISETDFSEVFAARGFQDAGGVVVSEPSPSAVDQFLQGRFGNRITITDGLGVDVAVQRQSQDIQVTISFFAPRNATDEEIGKWQAAFFDLRGVKIKRSQPDGFRRLARIELTGTLPQGEREAEELKSLVNQVASATIEYNLRDLVPISTLTVVYDLNDATAVIKTFVNDSLKTSGRTAEALSLGDRIQLIRSGHDKYLAAMKQKNPNRSLDTHDAVPLSTVKGLLTNVFPNTPKAQIEEMDRQVQKERDDFLKSIKID